VTIRTAPRAEKLARQKEGSPVDTSQAATTGVAEPARFEPDPTSIAAARRYVRGSLLGWDVDEDLRDDLMVIASELATNAVVHAGTAFEVSCAHLGGAIRLQVRDGYPARGLPAVLPARDPSRPSGRGLTLCASLSSAWGVEYTPTSKTVWCQLDLEPSAAPVGAAAARPGLRMMPEPAVAAVPAPEWAEFSDADLVRLRFDDMLSRAAHRACDAFAGDAAYLLVADPAGGGESWLASTGLAAESAPRLVALPVADEAAADAAPVVYTGTADVSLPPLADSGMRSAVVAQLLADGRSIGTVAVAADRPDAFGPDEAAALQHGADRLALLLQGRRLAESTRRQRDWLGYLAEASDLLSGTLEPQMTIAMLAQLVVPRLSTWCAVRLYDDRGAPGLDYVWHTDETLIDTLRALLDAAPAGLGTVERPGGTVAQVLGARGVPDALRLDTTVSLELHARGRRLGAVVLGRRAGNPFEPDALALAEELVRRAALAVDNALLYRLHRATSEALQRGLLPPSLPDVPGLDIGVAYQAAGQGLDVGGDFYDVFALDAEHWRFSVGDVAGNGPEAAGVTGLARHSLRLLGRQRCPLADAVGQLNTAILDQRGGRFLTLVHGEITPRPAGGMRVDLVVAGHPSPYLLHPNGKYDLVGRAQLLLGVRPDVPYRADTVLLAPGETLVCLTDGVTERRRDGRVLGEHDLVDLFAHCAGLSAAAAAAAIARTVVDYAPTPPRDDMAVLVLRVW
jgi:serine phosphatase RsbU (regulator of sigma subunit)/anti-sigma regulatory factor (Ser/Thr protein kinase)